MTYKKHLEKFNELILDEIDTFLTDFTRWELPEDKQHLLERCHCPPFDIEYDQRLRDVAQHYPYLADAELQEEYLQAEAAALAKALLQEDDQR